MKVLKCANCGAPLNIEKPSPAIFCEYCGGVNIIDSPESVFDETAPDETEEIVPRLLEPIQTFLVSYFYKGETISGDLLISEKEAYLKPNALNWFSKDIAVYFKLQDVVDIKKGALLFLKIYLRGGRSITISTYSKNDIINIINSQKEKLPQYETNCEENPAVIAPDGFEGEYEQVSGENSFPVVRIVFCALFFVFGGIGIISAKNDGPPELTLLVFILSFVSCGIGLFLRR
ncbi:MAG: hypothetical protein IJI37_01845 [Opitutales bacterium]|nr:hypothetical protein [Opitutales bacterium]